MRFVKLVLVLLLFISVNEARSQQAIEDNNIYSAAAIEIKPSYPGGTQKFMEYVETNFKYSAEAVKANISGKLIVSFIIEKDGSISTVNVIKDLGYETGREAIRLLERGGKWIPASQNGTIVRARYILPIKLDAAGTYDL